jgi:hypothetical protein
MPFFTELPHQIRVDAAIIGIGDMGDGEEKDVHG